MFLKLRKWYVAGMGTAALAVALSAAPGEAVGQMFATPNGSIMGGLPVSASAFFTLDANADTIDILVNNLQVDPTSVIQNISDLGLTLSTGQTAASLTSSLGLARTVNSNKTYTNGGFVATGWQIDSMAPEDIRLHVLGTGVGPAHTIIGDHGTGNHYNHANGSIKGNGPHNPFLFGPVDFLLHVPGIDNSTYIDSVTFSFGTSEGNNITVDCGDNCGGGGNNNTTDVPEPGIVAMLGGLLISGCAIVRRSRR